MYLHKLFFKSNGAPRPWLKRILFDKHLRLKGEWRWVVFDSSGDIRKAFYDWYSLVLHNPNPAIDPGWPAQRDQILQSRAFRGCNTITVVSPNATLYVARMLSWQLSRLNLHAELVTEMPPHFGNGLYIVICPQIYKRLPPREQRIVFQMEQSVSPRWFTQEYLSILYNSLAVFDYSLINIAYLGSQLKGQLKLYHVPVEPVPLAALLPVQIMPAVNPIDRQGIVFYGDPKSARRQRFLRELKKRFDIEVVQELYGEALWYRLIQAKLVLNIHYYENALLETTRISECLTLGLSVVSEASVDQGTFSRFGSRLVFTQTGEIEAMAQVISQYLSGTHDCEQSLPNDFEAGHDLKNTFQSLGVI